MFKFPAQVARLSTEAVLAIGGFILASILFGFLITSFATWFQTPIPEDPFLRGQYYFNQDENPNGPYDLVKAREAYTAALEESPNGYPLAWYQLGRIDFLEGKFVAALYKFDSQIEQFGDVSPNVYYMIGLTNGFKARVTQNEDDWLAAEEGFKTFLTYVPESPWARTDLAWVYFAQGKFESMLPLLEAGLQTHPAHPWLLNMYGLALLNTQRHEEALQYFRAAAEEAAKLTPEVWGRAYPGNNPSEWSAGLDSFRAAIQKNIELVTS